MATQWATPERQRQLVQLAEVGLRVRKPVPYRGCCLKGHSLCQDASHYVNRFTKVEVASGPMSPADVRDGRAIPFPCHGVGIVELAHAVSGARPIGPKRVPVQHEELSDMYGLAEERVTEDWKQEDRDFRSFERQRIQQPAPTGEVGRFGVFHDPNRRSTYDPIDVDAHVENRPRYYQMGYSVDGQMHRCAKVRISGTNIIIQVDVSQSIQEMSRGKRQRLRRQGKELKTELQLIEQAVATWWAR